MELKTPYRKSIDDRNEKLYAEWKELSGGEQSLTTAIYKHLGRKYKIFSRQGVWMVIKKMRALEQARNAELEDKLT